MINYLSGPLNNRFAILIILGDMVLPHGPTFWLEEVLEMMGWLGVPERTTRSVLARMQKKGWFTVERIGRRSRFTITEWGQKILRQGDLRIFEGMVTDWDGNWHLVVYALPNQERTLRQQVQKQLGWLGYGRLERGVWISPHERHQQLFERFTQAQGHFLRRHTHFFSGQYLGGLEPAEIVQRCWDLEKITSEYLTFIHRYRVELEELSQMRTHLDDKGRFLYRFSISFDFLPLLRQDPNLPHQLLPNPWVGHEAKKLYKTFRSIVGIPSFEN